LSFCAYFSFYFICFCFILYVFIFLHHKFVFFPKYCSRSFYVMFNVWTLTDYFHTIFLWMSVGGVLEIKCTEGWFMNKKTVKGKKNKHKHFHTAEVVFSAYILCLCCVFSLYIIHNSPDWSNKTKSFFSSVFTSCFQLEQVYSHIRSTAIHRDIVRYIDIIAQNIGLLTI
jgi:hypothetical protein